MTHNVGEIQEAEPNKRYGDNRGIYGWIVHIGNGEWIHCSTRYEALIFSKILKIESKLKKV